MTPVNQPARLRLGGRRYLLSSVRELRLGVCFVFRLFYVAPETTARFSQLDDRSRNRSPPWLSSSRPVRAGDAILPALGPGPARAGSGVDQPNAPQRWALRTARAASRSASRVRIAWRLSCSLRPRTSASCTFALPSWK